MKYIVLLNRYGTPILLEEDEDTAIFDSYREAEKAGEGNGLSNAAGFEIIKWDYVKSKPMEL